MNHREVTANHRKLPDTKGIKNASAKLADRDVILIRSLYATGSYSQRSLGRSFGVSQPTILRIVNRTYWKHIV